MPSWSGAIPSDTEALLERAAAQQKQGAVATAVATLRQLRLDSSDPRAWFLLGKSMILVGDARQAVTDPLVRALALMTQLGNLQGRGDVLNAMGVAHQRLGELDAATARYAEAAALRQQAGDERGRRSARPTAPASSSPRDASRRRSPTCGRARRVPEDRRSRRPGLGLSG